MLRSYDRLYTVTPPGSDCSLDLAFCGYCCIPTMCNSDWCRVGTQGNKYLLSRWVLHLTTWYYVAFFPFLVIIIYNYLFLPKIMSHENKFLSVLFTTLSSCLQQCLAIPWCMMNIYGIREWDFWNESQHDNFIVFCFKSPHICWHHWWSSKVF